MKNKTDKQKEMQKQLKNDNKERVQQYQRTHYANNKEKYYCEICRIEFIKHNMKPHLKTNRHLRNVECLNT